jgi:hypothetical protein
MPPREITQHTIVCDCCGTEPLAEIVGDKLVIRRLRHNRTHLVVLPLATACRLCHVPVTLELKGILT